MANKSVKPGVILAFPALQSVPSPSFPLAGEALRKYLELAHMLLARQKLNSHTKMTCENIAVIHGQVYDRLERGLQPAQASFDRMQKLMKELRIVDQSDHVAPATEQKESRYARIGIITRPGTEKAEIRLP